MKNLPDKIYLATTEEVQNLDNTFVGIAHSNPEDIIEPVEYIRKDVFVKRVEEFIYSALNDGIMGTANIEDFMRLFKKYMED